ncbi:hypothetical protein SDC9_108075 [bioreactor metagenome]|uniref:SIS domain-containing protein n=1 Tax=bioreactor metagenome TaxID=1076179 RepID=A0A645B839_9ZZZZ
MKRKNLHQSTETEAVQKLPVQLKELITYYTQGQGHEALRQVQFGSQPVFSGRGRGLLAAQYAACLCRQAGVRAAAYSVDEINTYPPELFSGSTAFVLFEAAGDSDIVLASNHPPLIHIGPDDIEDAGAGRLPNFSNPQLAELELINSMSVAWLLVRHLTGVWDGSEAARLQAIRQRAQLMADGYEPYLARCRDLLAYSPRWILLGGEEQNEALRFTAFQLAKKANRLLPWLLYKEYVENYQHLIDPDAAIIHLRSGDNPGVNVLLDQAEEKGAVVVEMTEGFFAPHRSQKNMGQGVETNLSPLLGCMAGYLLALSDRIA